MSDWADFCDLEGIAPNEPDQFDDWLSKLDTPQPTAPQGAHLVLEPRELMNGLADPLCNRCSGTGRLGRYSWNCGGRCFACLPDARWYPALERLQLASTRLTSGSGSGAA